MLQLWVVSLAHCTYAELRPQKAERAAQVYTVSWCENGKMKFIFLLVPHLGYSFYNNINRTYAELRQSPLHLPGDSFLNRQRLFLSPFL